MAAEKWLWFGLLLIVVVGGILLFMWAVTQVRWMVTDLKASSSDDLHAVQGMCREVLTRANMDLSEYRAEVRALTEALARKADVMLVYPRRGPIEESDGWFDGRPRITKVGPLVASDAAIKDHKDALKGKR